MRDATPRVRRAGYLLYILGTVLDAYASSLELKADPVLAVITSKGIPLAQIIFNDYSDVPEVKFNKNSTVRLDHDLVRTAYLQKLGIQKAEWQ